MREGELLFFIPNYSVFFAELENLNLKHLEHITLHPVSLSPSLPSFLLSLYSHFLPVSSASLSLRVGKKILKVNTLGIYRGIYRGKYSEMGIIPSASSD